MKTKIRIIIFPLAALAVLLMISNSCKKKSEDNNPAPDPPIGAVTDKDGNVYHTVTIGTQVWMVENLKTTKYNDGSAIPLVTDITGWDTLSTPGYCWYNNDSANKITYGAIYNWHTVNTGKLAPTGWHIPTYAEWSTLITTLGGDSVAGGRMKSIGTIEGGSGLWYAPNTGASNESGFSALPGAHRNGNGTFSSIGLGKTSYWWSATEYNSSFPWYLYLSNNTAQAYLVYGYNKNFGYYIRCIKNVK